MYREIKKKALILEQRKPFRREAAELIQEMTKIDWIWSDLRLGGGNLSREQVRRLLRGEILPEVPILEHERINGFLAMIRVAEECADMKDRLTEKLLKQMYGAFLGESEIGWRTNNPVLRMLGYNPPHFHEIEEQLGLFFRWNLSGEPAEDVVFRAAEIHDRLVEIFPFEDDSFLMARAAARYYLMSRGLPAPAWNVEEQSYYDGLREYLKTGSSRKTYDMLLRDVYNKMEVMIQLTTE